MHCLTTVESSDKMGCSSENTVPLLLAYHTAFVLRLVSRVVCSPLLPSSLDLLYAKNQRFSCKLMST